MSEPRATGGAVSRVRRVLPAYGDLAALARKRSFGDLVGRLDYSAEDGACRASIPIHGDVRDNSASLRIALRRFDAFLVEER